MSNVHGRPATWPIAALVVGLLAAPAPLAAQSDDPNHLESFFNLISRTWITSCFRSGEPVPCDSAGTKVAAKTDRAWFPTYGASVTNSDQKLSFGAFGGIEVKFGSRFKVQGSFTYQNARDHADETAGTATAPRQNNVYKPSLKAEQRFKGFTVGGRIKGKINQSPGVGKDEGSFIVYGDYALVDKPEYMTIVTFNGGATQKFEGGQDTETEGFGGVGFLFLPRVAGKTNSALSVGVSGPAFESDKLTFEFGGEHSFYRNEERVAKIKASVDHRGTISLSFTGIINHFAR